jgi:hypothetical protein
MATFKRAMSFHAIYIYIATIKTKSMNSTGRPFMVWAQQIECVWAGGEDS